MPFILSKTSYSLLFFLILVCSGVARKSHIINFRSPNLFPEGLAWDPTAQHFVVGSFHHRSINSVSDAGVFETLIYDEHLPPNASITGIRVDSFKHRLLAVIHSTDPLPPFNALAAYDLHSRKRLFLALLSDTITSGRQIANDVALDFNGNAYVTNSIGNFIWKVNANGEPSIFSESPIFTSQHVYQGEIYSFCGLNGIAYISKGYLLVVQSNTGKIFKVDADDGTARLVLLKKDLLGADGIAVRSDGMAVVVSQYTAWFIKSDDSWAEAVIYDEISLDGEKFPTSVAIRENNRAYVIYGKFDKAMLGNSEEEMFSIEEIESVKENEGEPIWLFVLIGFGLVYFLFWRFQMGQLVKNMNKKTA